VILTFYSYKGGVGRSMALANVGDILARTGLRVLMIDFDLEAPGLEQYFPIDHKDVRSRLGLLDLILRYKQAMSLGPEAAGEKAEFRKLQELFIAPIYSQLPSGGKLDLLPSGQRGTDEELSRYALTLRTFDWQDFYFNWAGELFFEWLRRTLVPGLYDVVLVDSRTGVTEMGGICAYQLADALVVLCAANHQSVQGTENVVRNFFSDRVRELRRSRPLEVLVVPARVEQRDDEQVQEFRKRFERAFTLFSPAALKKAGMSFWDLLIPYEARYALEEQVITDPGRAADRKKMAGAFRRLIEAVTLLAEPESKLREKLEGSGSKVATAEPQYDSTRRFARYDAFLSYSSTDKSTVEELARRLRDRGIEPFFDRWHLGLGEPWQLALERALQESQTYVIFLGSQGISDWQNEEMKAAFDAQRRTGMRIIPVLLPGAEFDSRRLPGFLSRLIWVDFRAGLDDPQALSRLVAGILSEPLGSASRIEVERGGPFRGFNIFEEEDAAFFFGREALIVSMAEKAKEQGLMAVVGSSGSGKSSLVQAGLIPALRQAAAVEGKKARFVTMRPGRHPLRSLIRALSSLLERHFEGEDPAYELGVLLDSFGFNPLPSRQVLVIDPLDDLWTSGDLDEHELSAFLHFILRLAGFSGCSFLLVLVLRSDFIPRASDHPGLASALAKGMVLVGPMRKDELRRAIELPTRSVGLAFEPGLVDLILEDVKDSPGTLPLLQSILQELWENRRQGFLTIEAYRKLRSVGGTLAAKAEAVFQSYNGEEQREIRQLLLRLVQPGEGRGHAGKKDVNQQELLKDLAPVGDAAWKGGSDTRRRVPLEDLVPAGSTQEAIRSLIEPMVEARVLTVALDLESQVVEISHETLIQGWPTLVGWIEEGREEIRKLHQLEAAAREWRNRKQNPDFLWRGARLASAKDWLKGSQSVPTGKEQEFLNASQERAQFEEEKRKRQLRLGRAFVVSLSITSLIALFFYWRLQEFEVKVVSAQAAAVRSAQAAATSYSPNGRYIFAISSSRIGHILDAATGRNLLPFEFVFTNVTAASFSPDSRALAVGTASGTLELVEFFENRREVRRLSHEGAVRSLAFSPDSSLIASGGDDGRVRLWRVKGGRSLDIHLPTEGSGVVALRFSPDGERLQAARADGKIYSWPVFRITP
jgi:cellulose biosynthesis protein BcsQ